MTMGTIYALAHPRTNEVRYIGQTIQALDARCATRAGYRHSLETRRKIGAAHRVVTDAMRLEILRLHDEVGLSWREVGIHVGIKASTCANVKRCLRKEGESD